ncbi:MFS transporter [Falsibacillus pallidus]|uniref:Putative MFS family arabinose efflux permease n=1 Tax=Falsibacillus pallidus TaxID=493781 RepID=A0A370GBQ7_9BACI|nr:MFS transporter [Falsibacillus pallidus]RDI39894.1 putative MFS family arabinose efflux permease [Falsibacillus pallidus]
MKKHTLASHNINILFWSQFFGTISFIQPVLTLFYMERGLTEANILVVLMFWSGGVLLGEVPTGVFADRFGPKASFITGAFVKMASISILFFADNIGLFCLYSAINGISVTFFSGADEALIYESLKKSDEQNLMDSAMGKIQSAGFISMIAAVLFGSYMARDLQNEQFILLIALGLCFQVVEVIFLFFLKNPSDHLHYRENPFTQVAEGMKAIKKAPQLLVMFLNVTLVFIPAGAVFKNFDQPFLKDAGLPVEWIGVMYALSALMGFFASRSIHLMTKRFSRVFLMNATGLLAVGGLVLAASLGDILWTALGAFFLLTFVRAVRYPIYAQLSNDLIPSEVRATTISLLSILDSVCDLVIFGSLTGLAVMGLPKLFFACAAITLIGTLLPIRAAAQRSLSKKAIS